MALVHNAIDIGLKAHSVKTQTNKETIARCTWRFAPHWRLFRCRHCNLSWMMLDGSSRPPSHSPGATKCYLGWSSLSSEAEKRRCCTWKSSASVSPCDPGYANAETTTSCPACRTFALQLRSQDILDQPHLFFCQQNVREKFAALPENRGFNHNARPSGHPTQEEASLIEKSAKGKRGRRRFSSRPYQRQHLSVYLTGGWRRLVFLPSYPKTKENGKRQVKPAGVSYGLAHLHLHVSSRCVEGPFSPILLRGFRATTLSRAFQQRSCSKTVGSSRSFETRTALPSRLVQKLSSKKSCHQGS